MGRPQMPVLYATITIKLVLNPAATAVRAY